MKKFYYTLLFLFATTVAFAQGISVQGIARDNASAALTDKDLNFTFSITQSDNVVLFAETQSIRTDNFGVFSHIVGTGNPTQNTFADVNFATKDLKLKVTVSYDGNDIEVYDQPFQYTPYALHARNGVPTGSVMPFLGTDAPDGWVLCNGQDLTSIDGAAALIAMVGNNAPNLQGMFLRGTGKSPVNEKEGPALKATQGDDNKSHYHYTSLSGSTSTTGSHSHSFSGSNDDNGDPGSYIVTSPSQYNGSRSVNSAGNPPLPVASQQ